MRELSAGISLILRPRSLHSPIPLRRTALPRSRYPPASLTPRAATPVPVFASRSKAPWREKLQSARAKLQSPTGRDSSSKVSLADLSILRGSIENSAGLEFRDQSFSCSRTSGGAASDSRQPEPASPAPDSARPLKSNIENDAW